MPWLTDSQKLTLSRVLSPSPFRNRKHEVDVRHVSFYSSELKGARQLVGALRDESKGMGHPGGVGDRYRNTLTRTALLDEAGKLTAAGNEVLQWADAHAALLDDPQVTAEHVDLIIYTRLLDLTKQEPDSRPAVYFRGLLHNLSLFIEGRRAVELNELAEDPEKLWVLQMIHSSGDEVARLLWLPPAEQDDFVTAWKAVTSTRKATSIAQDPVERTIREYIGLANKIQKDIRFRVRGFLKAWLAIGNGLPSSDSAADSRDELHSIPQAFLLEPISVVPLDHPRQWLLSGCPGSGKSHILGQAAREADGVHKTIRTTFHSETSYFDFVGSFRPAPVYAIDGLALLDAAGQPSQAIGRPLIDYRFVPGPLVRAYLYAVLNPTWQVVLIIEELNRANASAAFGDMLQLLERKAGTFQSVYDIEPHPALLDFLAQNGALQPAGTMRFPENLYLWATMNNADQGVQPLDSAFRRRWTFTYLGHQTPSFTPGTIKYAGLEHSWDEFRAALNSKLLDSGTHEDKLIGPYFLSPQERSDGQVVLNKLFLYLWDDVLRYQRDAVFSSGLRSFADVERAWKLGEGSPLGSMA